jgi:DNA invertase Pin-like site-specific DNA recombinase
MHGVTEAVLPDQPDQWKGRDRIHRGRGQNHRTSRLTDDDVRDIKRRLRDGESQASLGRRYDIAVSTIYKIKNGYGWNHVKIDD